MEFVKLENSDNSFSNDTEENPFEINKKPIDFFPFENILECVENWMWKNQENGWWKTNVRVSKNSKTIYPENVTV